MTTQFGNKMTSDSLSSRDFSKKSQMNFMPSRDHFVTPFDVTDSFSDIINESMINMQANYYNGTCGDVTKSRKLKTQSSNGKHYCQILYYDENFNNVSQINLPRTLPNDNQVLNNKSNTKLSSIMKRSYYQNASTNASKNLLTKEKVSIFIYTESKLFLNLFLTNVNLDNMLIF